MAMKIEMMLTQATIYIAIRLVVDKLFSRFIASARRCHNATVIRAPRRCMAECVRLRGIGRHLTFRWLSYARTHLNTAREG